MLRSIQITMTGAAVQVSATSIKARQAWIEAENASSAAMFVGDSAVTSSKGYKIQKATANIPGAMFLGPFDSAPIDLSLIYVIGTSNDKCNIHYIPF